MKRSSRATQNSRDAHILPSSSQPPDDSGESCWLVKGDEGVAVGHLDQLSLREELGEAPAVLGWHDAVLAGPNHQGRAVEVRQTFGRPEQQAGVCGRGPQR